MKVRVARKSATPLVLSGLIYQYQLIRKSRRTIFHFAGLVGKIKGIIQPSALSIRFPSPRGRGFFGKLRTRLAHSLQWRELWWGGFPMIRELYLVFCSTDRRAGECLLQIKTAAFNAAVLICSKRSPALLSVEQNTR